MPCGQRSSSRVCVCVCVCVTVSVAVWFRYKLFDLILQKGTNVVVEQAERRHQQSLLRKPHRRALEAYRASMYVAPMRSSKHIPWNVRRRLTCGMPQVGRAS